MRRRKHRFPLSSDKNLGVSNTGIINIYALPITWIQSIYRNIIYSQCIGQQSGSSEGPDPSSSDLSADTVIYMGPSDEATDGEHPPVYLPSMTSGDNRCIMNKALKGSVAEKPSKLPQRKTTQKRKTEPNHSTVLTPHTQNQFLFLTLPHIAQSPVPGQRTDSLKRRLVSNSSPVPADVPSSTVYQFSPQTIVQSSCSMPNSPKMVAPTLKQQVSVSKASNVPTPKGSPLRRAQNSNQGSPKRQLTGEEQWIDGPRLSKSKVAEARYLLREINHVKQREQWIDGPNMSPAKSLAATSLPAGKSTVAYGFMDSHKKTMIRQWVENQSSQLFPPSTSSQQPPRDILQLGQLKTTQPDNEPPLDVINYVEIIHPNTQTSNSQAREAVAVELSDQRSEVSSATSTHPKPANDHQSERSVHSSVQKYSEEEEDEDSGPSEVPPALPLIEPLSSREISHDSLHIICSRHVSRESLGIASYHISTKDCGLQVTEDDIVRAMG